MAKDMTAERTKFMLQVHRKSQYAEDGSGVQLELAVATVKYLRKVVATQQYSTVDELLDQLRSEGKIICNADPSQFVVVNMLFRVMRLVREELARLVHGLDETAVDPYDALHSEEAAARAVDKKQLKEAVIGTLNEYLVEIENSEENMASQGSEHVQSGDTVLIYGAGRSVEAFLKAAARKHRDFTVHIGKCSPSNTGQLTYNHLSQSKSFTPRVNLIDDCAMAAVMPSISKVILGAHAVLADGGFIGQAGTYSLCLAAKRYSVPVIVCAAVYKLTPRFLSADDQERFNKLASPRDVLPFTEGTLVSGVRVYNPTYDYIPPDLVTLYIMQLSGNAPSYVYRLLGEYYHPDDVQIANCT